MLVAASTAATPSATATAAGTFALAARAIATAPAATSAAPVVEGAATTATTSVAWWSIEAVTWRSAALGPAGPIAARRSSRRASRAALGPAGPISPAVSSAVSPAISPAISPERTAASAIRAAIRGSVAAGRTTRRTFLFLGSVDADAPSVDLLAIELERLFGPGRVGIGDEAKAARSTGLPVQDHPCVH